MTTTILKKGNTVLPVKKALVLYGSPRQDGFTAQMLQRFLEELQCSSYTVDAYQRNIHPCTGCGYCERVQGCIYNDFDDIHVQLCSADYLIVASPVYNLSFPSPLKAVFDRMQRYFSARFAQGIRPPIAKHKQAAMLLTCGSKNSEGADIIRKQLNMIFTILNASLEQEVVWQNTDSHPSFAEIAPLVDKAAHSLKLSNHSKK